MAKGGDTIHAEELVAFHHEIEQHLGVKGSVASFGVSRILQIELRDRRVTISTNGSYLRLTADLQWSGFPEDALLVYAPEDSYKRAKFLEDDSMPARTNDSEFDRAFLLLPGNAEEGPAIPSGIRRGLLEFCDLRPEVRGVEIGGEPLRVTRRVHIRSEPELRESDDGSFSVRLGTQRFTTENAAVFAGRLIACAERLEASLAEV